MNTTDIVRAANSVDDTAFADSWSDAEGRASFERIVADDRSTSEITLPRHRYRRRLALGVALAASAGVAVAIVGIPGSNHGAQSAWAVRENADGSVTVTINDYRDPAGLEARLRAAGLRAEVTTVADSCADTRNASTPGDELGTFNGDLSTFTAPYTWQKLFAGSSDFVLLGPGQIITKFPDGRVPDALRPQHISFTVHPDELPPGDTINIGFPASSGPAAGHAVLVDVEKTGAPIHCSPPFLTAPAAGS